MGNINNQRSPVWWRQGFSFLLFSFEFNCHGFQAPLSFGRDAVPI